MAKTEGFADENISVAKVRVIVKVAATEAGGGNADLDFICLWRRNISRLLNIVVNTRSCPRKGMPAYYTEVFCGVEDGGVNLGRHVDGCWV